MGFHRFAFPAVVAGWILLVTTYDIPMAVAVLGITLVTCTAIAGDRVAEKLRDEDPIKRLTIGIAFLVATAILFMAAEPFSLLRAAPVDAVSVPLAVIALLYSVIAQASLLSLRLIASGCRQALQRRRYSRGLRRSTLPPAADRRPCGAGEARMCAFGRCGRSPFRYAERGSMLGSRSGWEGQEGS
jgi:hypothetical protein